MTATRLQNPTTVEDTSQVRKDATIVMYLSNGKDFFVHVAVPGYD